MAKQGDVERQSRYYLGKSDARKKQYAKIREEPSNKFVTANASGRFVFKAIPDKALEKRNQNISDSFFYMQ